MDELNYFSDLLNAFGKHGIEVDPSEALQHIQNKYINLTHFTPTLIEILKQYPDEFKEIFTSIIIFSHHFLFEDYFINAGQFRNSKDENGGAVYFGPFNKNGRTKFKGCPPDLIGEKINDLLNILIPFDSNPIDSAIRFYQGFVYIHPFYDGNGRIGRLIVSIYLGYYGFFINWEALEEKTNKSKLIRLLNRCHNLMGKPWFEKRMKELIAFVKEFILNIPIDE